ncbi:HIT family protein [Helicobacter cetorum]|uniref:Histidine triad (HIT) family protein n=1 Tax=Helicobacter cetorum (strain ATCC BAA-429 / MIT 00-7128) TaxID=182217 RepID=I0EMQ1_HELC0|nr:HIT domain-containing protein [Helicobacter cetorum]AFI04220.1 histidine triad (HIT) family protein [Helicobacter cetorum MIT 00-7128]
MQHLYAPWRKHYLIEKPRDCVFCEIAKNPTKDEENKVLYRNDKAFIVMNAYPYNPGHVLIIPHVHIASVEDLELETWLNVNKLVPKVLKALYAYGAQGVNVGLNLKKSAGAGIPEHLHMHLVPRFVGDSNFMSVIGETRVHGKNFDEVFLKIRVLLQEFL